mmetsp:Transcript_12916/g.34649  ORF Transcript_12916/g.34649 Transcript_12916/m.34649 type:complete len:156 (+) Transcript_12916:72-539(+)
MLLGIPIIVLLGHASSFCVGLRMVAKSNSEGLPLTLHTHAKVKDHASVRTDRIDVPSVARTHQARTSLWQWHRWRPWARRGRPAFSFIPRAVTRAEQLRIHWFLICVCWLVCSGFGIMTLLQVDKFQKYSCVRNDMLTTSGLSLKSVPISTPVLR